MSILSPELQDPSVIPEGVYARSVQSGWWYGFGMVAQRVIAAVSFLVLVRLLKPEDYGAIAAVFVVVELFDRFTSVPFADALVQRKGDVEPYIDPLWTWDLLRVGLIACIVFFFGHFFADYFGMEGVARAVMPFTGILLLLPASSNPRQLYFSRNINMRQVFLRDLVAQLAYAVVAVGYALLVEASFAALFMGHVARMLAGNAMSYVLYPVRPRLSFQFKRLWELAAFSTWSYAHNTVEYVATTADKWLVGGIMEVERLGLYTRARDLSLTASAIVASAFDKIGMPAFARVQGDRVKIQAGFQKSLDVFALTAIPFSLLLLLEAGTTVPLVLGNQWVAIVLPVKIFAVGAFAYVGIGVFQPLFTGLGRPDLSFKLRLLQMVVSLPLLAIGGRAYGPVGLAVAVSIGWVVTLAYGLWRSRPLLQFDKRDALPVLIPTIVASLVTTFVDALIRTPVHALHWWWIDLGLVGCLGVLYLGVLLGVSRFLGHGPYATASVIIGPFMRWRRVFAFLLPNGQDRSSV